VRSEDESAVVPVVVTRPLARRAVIAVAGFERDSVERVHLLAALGGEGAVDVLAQRLAVLRDREVAPLGEPLVGVLPAELVPEGSENRRVEPLRRLEVGDAKGDVVDHSGWWLTASMLLPSGSRTYAP